LAICIEPYGGMKVFANWLSALVYHRLFALYLLDKTTPCGSHAATRWILSSKDFYSDHRCHYALDGDTPRQKSGNSDQRL
jgi:hypothetical protein